VNDGKDVADVCRELQVSRVRDECLNINMFWSLAQARVVISDWKEDYNHRRRHSALGYQAPAVYAAARTHQ
jgi:putative transposase